MVLTPVNNPLISEIKKVSSVLRIDKDLIIGTQEDGIYILHDNENGEQVQKHITPKNNPVLNSNRITFMNQNFLTIISMLFCPIRLTIFGSVQIPELLE